MKDKRREIDAVKLLDMKVFPKTVYTDIVNMPDPMLLGLTIHYYNHSDTGLYMKIFGSGPSPWSSNSVELGLLASGSDAYINLDNFLSRTRPASETTEAVTLTLRGYTDAGYSTLAYTFARDTTVVFIKSDDGTWTTDEEDNFDGGTVEGWTIVNELNNDGGAGYPMIAVATDYVLSSPNSCKGTQRSRVGAPVSRQLRGRMEKQFTTPNKTTVYAIFNLRFSTNEDAQGEGWLKYLDILEDATTLIHLGKSYDTVQAHYYPKDKWLRLVVPLTKNATLTIKFIISCYARHISGANSVVYCYTWLDDFKIISK